MIKHVWFDLAGTLTIDTPEFHEAHDTLRYQTYADAVGKPLSKEIENEYQERYKKYGSNSAVFRSLGLPSDYWMQHFATFDETKYYHPDELIYGTLPKLKKLVPISLFTNLKPDKTIKVLKVINIDPEWFTYRLSGDDIAERKPAPDGFLAMIAKTQLSPEEIMYVGDRVDVDIKPAKAVGMKTALVWGESPEADYSFKSFEEILGLFE